MNFIETKKIDQMNYLASILMLNWSLDLVKTFLQLFLIWSKEIYKKVEVIAKIMVFWNKYFQSLKCKEQSDTTNLS